jgi:lipopolysaccharide/colanic/teichoic acid biosynthesis glycosyltransferase
MSLVGPRPHAKAHDEYYALRIPAYVIRQKVKPGITGWAQINGLRGETPTLEAMRKRVGYDLWYVENFSLGLDIQILLLTPFEMLRRRDAY